MASIMLDLESLDNTPTSVITQIGAVSFTKDGIINRLQIYVDPESCQERGLTISASTVLWWLKQSDAARKHFETKGDRLAMALTKCTQFFNAELDKDGSVWGNGSDFDNAILRNAYKMVGTEEPWKYWQNACYRTIKGCLKQIPCDPFGTAHVAVDDAEKQARHLIKIAQMTGLPV